MRVVFLTFWRIVLLQFLGGIYNHWNHVVGECNDVEMLIKWSGIYRHKTVHMVWFQFYPNVFIGTHTKRLEKRGETRKAAEKPEKQRKRREGGKPGRDPLFSACWISRISTTSRGRITWEQSRGSRARRQQGRGSELLLESPGPQSHPGPSPPTYKAPVTHPLTPTLRSATYFWSIQAGRAPAGRAGRAHARAWWQLAPCTVGAHQHAAMPALTRPPSFWNPPRSPSSSQPSPSHWPFAPPLQLHRGWRRGQEGGWVEAEATPEPGAGLGQGAGNCSGVGDQGRRLRAREEVGILHGGRCLRRVGGSGCRTGPFSAQPIFSVHAGLGCHSRGRSPAPASTLGGRLRKS